MTDAEKNKNRENIIHRIGQELARNLPGFYGKISFNLHDGKYVNSNIEESLRPKKQ